LGFALGAIRDAAQGLAHAHAHRNAKGDPVPIIHRDVTPRNVMVDFDGAIKVLDFGIARAKGSERRTQAGMVRGTTAYMSPEQAIGKEPDPRSDLFSLGIIFHELLTGQRLFYKGNPAQEMAAVYEGEIPSPSKVNRRVPKALDPVVLRLLERKLDKRYQTATEFIRDLSLSAGSTMWTKERSAEMVRGQFSERQQDSEALIDRIPSRSPDFPEGRTVISRGGPAKPADDERGSPRTLLAAEPLSNVRPPRPGAPREPVQRRDLPEPLGLATDPARVLPHGWREPVTDTSRARDAGLNAAELFGSMDEPEKTRLLPPQSRKSLPPVEIEPAGPVPSRKALAPVDNELPTDPRRGAVSRREPSPDEEPPSRSSDAQGVRKDGSTNLVIAAVLALVLGAAGGAFIFKSMQKQGPGASMVRVTIDADRPAEVVMQGGQLLGKTPVTAVFPEGHHVLQFREAGAPLRVWEVDVKANAENSFEVTLDGLKPPP
jgi:serine/threonine protein kinase